MAGSFKEKRVQSLIIKGVGMIVFGAIIAVVLVAAGIIGGLASSSFSTGALALVSLCTIVVLGGVGLTCYGIYAGYQVSGFGDLKRPPQTLQDVYVIAALIYDERNELVFDPEVRDAEDLRYLVKVGTKAGETFEFDTHADVFGCVGEGMRGDIIFQGNWLNQFTRQIREDKPYTY